MIDKLSGRFKFDYLLLALIVVENLSLYIFFASGVLTQGKNAWCLFLSSILFGVTLLFKFHRRALEENLPKPTNTVKISYIVTALFFLAGLLYLGFQYYSFFLRSPVNPAYSDIIPNIEILCKRFLSGHYPYDPIHRQDYSMNVTLLPFQWLPFTVAEILKIDYRWIAFIIWCFAALLLFIRSLRTNNIYMRFLSAFLILASNYFLFSNALGIISITVEIMISGYYMLLISGLNQRSGMIQGLFMSLCILSRYSLVLWLPLYAFVLIASGNRRQLSGAMLVILATIIVAYVVPFLSKDWGIFYRGYKEYDNGTLFEWTRVYENGINQGKPVMLFSGTGFAYFIYTRFTGIDIPSRIRLCKEVHLACCVFTSLAMGVWYWFNRRKINYRIFLLGSFKIYFAVFLFLVQVPYSYLMIVGNFVSIAIFCEQARYRLKDSLMPDI